MEGRIEVAEKRGRAGSLVLLAGHWVDQRGKIMCAVEGEGLVLASHFFAFTQ